MTRRKNISGDLIESIVAHQSEKGYKTISKQFEVNYSTIRKIIRGKSQIPDLSLIEILWRDFRRALHK